MITTYGYRKTLYALIEALLLLTMMLLLTGCEKRGTCESCKQEEVLHAYTLLKSDGIHEKGDVVYICDYCRQWYKLLGN